MAERKIPQNLEAEMAVLGSAFLTNYAFDKVCEGLSEEMFLSKQISVYLMPYLNYIKIKYHWIQQLLKTKLKKKEVSIKLVVLNI